MKKSLILAVLIATSIYQLSFAEDRILTVQLTKGPYEVTADETDAYEKANITESQSGLPITYYLTVTANNVTLSGVRLDAWFANAGGLYSGISSLGTGDQDFLRGWQTTNSSGIATFYGIFPGVYSGRTAHVHIRVRRYAENGTVIYNNTTQLFFPENVIEQVMTLTAYKSAAKSNWNTDNDDDMFYSTENLLNLTGDTTNGYVATYAIEIPLTETSQSSADDGTFFSGPRGSGWALALVLFVGAVLIGVGVFLYFRKKKADELRGALIQDNLEENNSPQQSILMTNISKKLKRDSEKSL